MGIKILTSHRWKVLIKIFVASVSKKEHFLWFDCYLSETSSCSWKYWSMGLLTKFICRQSPIAIHQQEANEQHYEVPADFYKLCLGPKLKYSSCYFKVGENLWIVDVNKSQFSRMMVVVWQRQKSLCWKCMSQDQVIIKDITCFSIIQIKVEMFFF